MRTVAKRQYDAMLAANEGKWPKSIPGYIRMVWLLNKPTGIRCDPDPAVPVAELVPTVTGSWIVRYNPDLPDATIKAALVHEASEYLSRRDRAAGPLFAGSYSGESYAAADTPPAIDSERLTEIDRMHIVANAVVALWCRDHKLAADRILSPKIAPHKGPRTNWGYANQAVELAAADPFEDACV